MNFPTSQVKSLEILFPPLSSSGILLIQLMFIHIRDILLFRYTMFAPNVSYKATLTVPRIRKCTAGKASRRAGEPSCCAKRQIQARDKLLLLLLSS